MRNKKRSGFTLIELMVVIGIIGILSGLLFPAFQHFKEIARRTKCRSNLRQIGFAMKLYASSFNGRYPVADTAAKGAAGVLAHPLLTRTLANPEILVCPSDRVVEIAGSFSDVTWQSTSFAVVPGRNESDSANSLVAADDDHQPAGAVFAGYHDATSDSEATAHTAEGGNAVFLDGHAEWCAGPRGVCKKDPGYDFAGTGRNHLVN